MEFNLKSVMNTMRVRPTHRVPLLPRRLVIAASVGLWILLCMGGLAGLVIHTMTPGPDGQTPRMWPRETAIERIKGRPILLLFVHPNCPCSSATLTELARAMPATGANHDLWIVLYCPENKPDEWTRSGLRRAAEGLPGAKCFVDRGGVEAARYGITTSGHTVFFDQQGDLQFSGGVTGARGHEGDNPGRAQLSLTLCGKSSRPWAYPVYGCPIRGSVSTECITCNQGEDIQ